MKRRTKYIAGGSAAVLFILILAGVCGGGKMTEVKIEQVEPRDLVASVVASGQIQPFTKVDISADITGRITKLAVKEGDLVTKGQFLLEIDPDQYHASVSRSQAGVAGAQAQETQARVNYEQAQRNYERIRELQQRNPRLVSADQLDQAKTAAEVNKAQLNNATYGVAQARAALRDAQSSLNRTTIVAPISGRVTRVNVEEGETAIMGTLNKDAATLLTISDLSEFETKVKVDETDVAHISVGDSAWVDIDAFPDTTFRGVVTRISSSSIRNTSALQTDQAVDYEVTVRLVGAPPDTRPDFTAHARIVTATRSQVLAIPIIALTIRENTPVENGDAPVTMGGSRGGQAGRRDVEGVFVVDKNNVVTFRPVKVGVAGDQYFEVREGLRQGERIVAGTYQAIRELKDGTRVREMKADNPRSR